MYEQKRAELAQSAKNRGNKYYAAKKYQKAIEMYTKAIHYYHAKGNPKCAVFFSNRAACFANLSQFDKVRVRRMPTDGRGGGDSLSLWLYHLAAVTLPYSRGKVIEDCTAALESDPKYARALSRRAAAFEKMDRPVDALHDLTVTCIVEEFKNAATMEAADRVLRDIAKNSSKELFAVGRSLHGIWGTGIHYDTGYRTLAPMNSHRSPSSRRT